MFTLLMTLTVIVAVLLVLVVLSQNSKGGGLSSQFGGSGASNMIGVKKTGDLLERITWGLAVALVVLSISTKFIMDGEPKGTTSTSLEKASEEQPASIPGLGSEPTDADATIEEAGAPETENTPEASENGNEEE